MNHGSSDDTKEHQQALWRRLVFRKTRARTGQPNRRQSVVVCAASRMGGRPHRRHFQLERSIRHEFRLFQGQNSVVRADGRNASQRVLGNIAVHNASVTLLQIDSGMTSGDTSSMGCISVSISYNVGSLNLGSASRTTDVNTRGSTIMDIAISNGHLATINVDNSASRGRTDFDVFHDSSRRRNDHHRLVIGAVGRLNLNGSISIPNVCNGSQILDAIESTVRKIKNTPEYSPIPWLTCLSSRFLRTAVP